MSKSRYETIFARQLAEAGLQFEREYKFHPERDFRVDFAFPELRLIFEVEGGVYSQGRHTRGSGFIKDCEKYAEANLLGWWVYRIPAPWIATLRGKRLIPCERGVELAKRAVEVLRD